ncbi:glycosyltransferase family A protein [Serinicoccus kebangsaanensis]|uniref:glycosyltransferase family A protein n=1 Tax=Serinicoccus kebangsaanensis TaxID=2602069 RepID=UPI00124D673C|nr:glycosyltransferase family A protein [Serinicoccus kebangsaanensis]
MSGTLDAVLVPPGAGAPGAWTTTQLTAIARERPDALAQLGLRTTSPSCADALALVATRGRLDARTLAAALPDAAGTVVDPRAAAALAQLWAGVRQGPGAPGGTERPDLLGAGADLYAVLLEVGALPEVAAHHQGAGQAMFLAGRHALLRRELPRLPLLPDDVRHDLVTDLAHPALSGADGEEEWVRLLSQPFVDAGLAPLRLTAPDRRHAFDRLSGAAAGTVQGPLVTVVVPAWRPDEGLLTSVASLTTQTHTDLEILVVDDASGPAHADLFEQVAALDPRVRVLTMERNGGSYLARRAAIAQSTGAFVTTQDADDWSHPQRLEHQVAMLQDHPDAPASRSLAIRAMDDLTHQWFGYSARRPNASSLMVRREVFDRAGTFLPMRKSADSEYAERLVALLGPVADTGTPLAVTRLRAGSLSRGDFTLGWHHPDRVAFRGSYRAWHRSLVASDDGASPTDEQMPEVPAAYARGLDGVRVAGDHVDLVLAADLGAAVGSRPATDGILDGARETVRGVWHLERPTALRPGRREMHPSWFDAVATRPDLHVLTRTHEARVGTLVLLDLDAVLLASAQPCALRPERVLLAVADQDVLPGPTGLPVDLLAVREAARHWWGVDPAWVAAPGADPVLLADALPGLDIQPWPGLEAAAQPSTTDR